MAERQCDGPGSGWSNQQGETRNKGTSQMMMAAAALQRRAPRVLAHLTFRDGSKLDVQITSEEEAQFCGVA